MCASVHRSALTCCRTYPKVHFDVTIPGYPRSSPATATSSQVRLRKVDTLSVVADDLGNSGGMQRDVQVQILVVVFC